MGPSPRQVEPKDYKTSRSWVPAPVTSSAVDHGSNHQQVEPKDYKTSRSWARAPGRSNPKTIKLVDHGSEPRAGRTQRL